jgi:hypothetical protein
MYTLCQAGGNVLPNAGVELLDALADGLQATALAELQKSFHLAR